MSQERKSFTVSDRRHFTSEGEPRHEEAEAAPPPDAPLPAESPTPKAPPAKEPREEFGPPPGAEVPETADFASFLVSLAAQAGGALQAEKDEDALPAARYLISVLEMLEDKTRGRRTTEEDEILTTLLYELRMAYVGRTRRGGA